MCFYRTSALRGHWHCCVSNKQRRDETARGFEIGWDEQFLRDEGHSFSDCLWIIPKVWNDLHHWIQYSRSRQNYTVVSISITILKLEAFRPSRHSRARWCFLRGGEARFGPSRSGGAHRCLLRGGGALFRPSRSGRACRCILWRGGTQLPRQRCPPTKLLEHCLSLTRLLKWWCPLTIPPKRRCLLTFSQTQSPLSSMSPQSPLQSPLQSGSPQSPYKVGSRFKVLPVG